MIKHLSRPAGLCLSLIPWILVLLSSNRGFDITDESFYLMNFKFPLDITASYFFFGIAARPLYSLSGGNITIFRIMSILIWMFVATVTSCFTINFLSRRQAFSESLLKSPQNRFLASLLPLASGGLYYSLWLLTPSYNWLMVVFLAVFIIGLQLFLDKQRPIWLSEIGLALLAYSSAIIFWSRAPSVFLLFILFVIILLLMRKDWKRLLRVRSIAVGFTGFVLGICLPIFYGFSFEDIIRTLSQGNSFLKLLESAEYDLIIKVFVIPSKKIFKIVTDNPYIRNYTWLWIIPFMIICFLFRFNKDNLIKYLSCIWLLSSIVFVSISSLEGLGNWSFTVFSIVFIFILCVFIIPNLHIRDRIPRIVETIIISVLLFSFSIVFAYSTSNSYGSHIELASYFIFASIVLILVSLDNSRLNCIIFRSSLFILFIFISLQVYSKSLTPYRQKHSVWEMNHIVQVDESKNNKLLVSRETQRYINELRALAGEIFVAKTPLIDMTGHSPGAAFLLGGRAPVFPWLLGGYPGSDISAEHILGLWSDSDLKSAWILTAESGGIRPISLSALENAGLDFPSDYELLGTVRRPESDEIQGLWRPMNIK